MGFNRLERRPAADGHHHAGIHPFVNEEPLSEAPPKIVTRDVAKVLVAGAVGGSLGGAMDDSPDAAGREVDIRVVILEVAVASELVEVALDIAGEVGVARLAVTVLRVLALGNAQPEVVAVAGAADVFRLNLRHLEGAEADEGTELDNKIIATGGGRSPQLLDLRVGQPDFVALTGAVLPHTVCHDKHAQILSDMIGHRPANGVVSGSTRCAAICRLRFV